MATYTAESTSQAHVAAALALASSGDTVQVPAGESDWGDTSVTIPAGVIVIGAGIASTIITDGQWIINEGSILSYVRCNLNSLTAIVYLNQTGNNWRIHHCYFVNETTTSRNAIHVRGPYSGSELCPYGLIDNCSFEDCRILTEGNAQLFNDPGYIFLQGSLLGTAYAVYVEDCDFTFSALYAGGNCIDENYGGRYVLRHCTMTDTYPEVHACGNAPSNVPSVYASRTFEIYENTLTNTGAKNIWGLGRIRAGTGVIYNNALHRTAGSYAYQMIFDYTPEAVGDEGLSYPCPFQLGRGTWPAETPIYNCAVGGDFPEQNLEPVYCWGNTIDSGDWYLINSAAGLIQASRDIYVATTHPTYVPYTYPHPLQRLHKGPMAMLFT